MTAKIQDVITAFGNPSPPSVITQVPFDYDPGHYQRLLDSGEKPDPIDLYSYADDLMYQKIQLDLFAVLLPLCLSAWQKNLMASEESEYAGFVEQFSAALAKHAGFRDLLPSSNYAAVSDFMCHAILDKIEEERSLSFTGMRASPYKWIYAIGMVGTAFPTIHNLWEGWWNRRSCGRACGVLQYASIFMYPDDRNPIFSPWTPDAGGGPPEPWETGGHIFEQSWLNENTAFLRGTFTASYIRESLSTAATTLRKEMDCPIPDMMVAEFDCRIKFVERRIAEFLDNLSRPLGKSKRWATQ